MNEHCQNCLLLGGEVDRLTIELIIARREERERCAKVAKAAWLTSSRGTIGDADRECELCEEISATILALEDEK